MSDIISLGVISGSLSILAAASLHDIAARTIPNWMPLGLAALGLASRFLDATTLQSLALCAVVFSAGLVCWRRGWLGGGDVKLLSAAVLTVPPYAIIQLVTLVAFSGGVLGLFYLAARRLVPLPSGPRPAALLPRIARAERWRMRRGGPLPYACAIGAGAALTLIKVGT